MALALNAGCALDLYHIGTPVSPWPLQPERGGAKARITVNEIVQRHNEELVSKESGWNAVYSFSSGLSEDSAERLRQVVGSAVMHAADESMLFGSVTSDIGPAYDFRVVVDFQLARTVAQWCMVTSIVTIFLFPCTESYQVQLAFTISDVSGKQIGAVSKVSEIDKYLSPLGAPGNQGLFNSWPSDDPNPKLHRLACELVADAYKQGMWRHISSLPD